MSNFTLLRAKKGKPVFHCHTSPFQTLKKKSNKNTELCTIDHLKRLCQSYKRIKTWWPIYTEESGKLVINQRNIQKVLTQRDHTFRSLFTKGAENTKHSFHFPIMRYFPCHSNAITNIPNRIYLTQEV